MLCRIAEFFACDDSANATILEQLGNGTDTKRVRVQRRMDQSDKISPFN